MLSTLASTVERYLASHQDDASRISGLTDQISDSETLNSRKNFRGHATASAWILSRDRTKMLFQYHKTFHQFLPAGGHIDPDDTDPLSVARREALEELGVTDLEYLPVDPEYPLVPIDMDSHYIPPSEKKGEPEHFHHDFAYVFITDERELTTPEPDSVGEITWLPLSALPSEPIRIARTLERMRSAWFLE